MTAKRTWVVVALAGLALGSISCGTYEVLGSGADVTFEDLAPGDRVRLSPVGGGQLEDVVVELSDDALICKWRDHVLLSECTEIAAAILAGAFGKRSRHFGEIRTVSDFFQNVHSLLAGGFDALCIALFIGPEKDMPGLYGLLLNW